MSDIILIIGDSFCAERDRLTDWPVVFRTKFSEVFNTDFKLRGKGFPACSWWPVKNLLYQELKNELPYALILCHTEAYRIPTIDNSAGGYLSNSDPIFKKFYEKYFNDDFHRWAQTAWYKELDNILEEFSIPYVLHLMGFRDSQNFPFKKGIICTEILFEIQHIAEKKKKLNPYGCRNHFDDFDNEAIGNLLADKISKLPKFYNGYVNFNLKGILK
jgi:hypothetical protein